MSAGPTRLEPGMLHTLLDGYANGYQHDAERLTEQARELAHQAKREANRHEQPLLMAAEAIVQALQGQTAATLALAHVIDRATR